MDPERRDRLKQIYFAALDLTGEALESYLAEACGGDEEMADEIRSLIAADRATADTFLERPAVRDLGLVTVTDTVHNRPHGDDGAEEASPPVRDWERYTDLELIASGGMGDVFRAFDPRLKRNVALKFIRAPSSKHVGRFLREAEAQARVEHENVLEVYETGEVEGQLYIALRYISGPTLKDTRDETSVEEKVVIMRQVAEAIHAAHRQGLVHRDIKPSNILIERTVDGVLKPWVTDFGIVADDRSPALTTTGDLVGTPWYMAPERLGGDESLVDRRSDIYSLGVTLFQYLSDERPYDTDNAIELFGLVKDAEPRQLRQVAPDLPQDLETIVMKCLEREPERRYPSARDLADDLGRYLDGEPIAARRPSLSYRFTTWVRRNRALAAVSAAAVILLAILAIVNIQARREARLRDEVERDFTHRVEEIDNIMRLARVAPTHDLSADKELVRVSIDTIRERLEATGLVGEGAGHFALGRAYLALGEHRRAREHLQRALSRGYDGRAVSAAVGQVLAALYREQVQEVERIADDEARDEARTRAERELRDPALTHLRRAGPVDTGNPELIQAMIAFLEERYDDALSWARRGSAKLPWLYEALKLEGDVHSEVGFASWRRGEADQARRSWDLALEAYDRAAAVARSDVGSHLGSCRLGQNLMQLEAERDRSGMETYFDVALDACRKARIVDPKQVEVLRLIADLHSQRAMAELHFGGDPRASIERAVRAATEALALEPEDPGARLAQGNSFLALALEALRRGDDPASALDEAVEAYDLVLQVNSRSIPALRNKGRALAELARSSAARGDDPTPHFQRAAEAYAAATAVAPDDVHLTADLARTLLDQARVEAVATDDEDDGDHLSRATELYGRLVEEHANYAPGHAGLGACRLLAARRGTEPEATIGDALAAAEQAFAAAVELDPGLLEAWAGLAETAVAAASATDGRAARILARNGLEAADTALELDPDYPPAVRAQRDLLRLVGDG